MEQLRKEITRRKKSYVGKHLKSELIRILCESDLEKIEQDHIDYNDDSDPTGELRRDQNLEEYEERCKIYKIRDDAKLQYHEDQINKHKNVTREARSKLDNDYSLQKSKDDLLVRNMARLRQNSVNSTAQQQSGRTTEKEKNGSDHPDLKPDLVEAPVDIGQYYYEVCISIASSDYEVRGDRIPGLKNITSGFGARHVRCDPTKYIVTFGTDQEALQRAHDCVDWLRHKSELFSRRALVHKPHIPVFYLGEELDRRGPVQESLVNEESKSGGRSQLLDTRTTTEGDFGGIQTQGARGTQGKTKKSFESNASPTRPTGKSLAPKILRTTRQESGDNSTEMAKVPKRILSDPHSPDFPVAKKPRAERTTSQKPLPSDLKAPQKLPKVEDVKNTTVSNKGLGQLMNSTSPALAIPRGQFVPDSPVLVLLHAKYPIGEYTREHLVGFIENKDRKNAKDFVVELDWDGLRIKFKTGNKGQRLAYLRWKELNGKLLCGIPAELKLEWVDEAAVERRITEDRRAKLQASLKCHLPRGSGIVTYPVRPTLKNYPFIFLPIRKNFTATELRMFWNAICNKKPDEIAIHIEWIKVDREGLFICFKRTIEGQGAAADCPHVCFESGWRNLKSVDFNVVVGVIA